MGDTRAMSWQDFDVESALERDLLRRALPLIPTSGGTSDRWLLDQATGTVNRSVTVSEYLGPNSTGCIELLAIRPLLVGAAWKVLDLLLGTALDQTGELPISRFNSIAQRSNLAVQHAGRPSAVQPMVWHALCEVYADTVELRHSLVHRRVHLTSSEDLVGTAPSGAPLQPFTPEEQDAFARTAQLAAEVVTTASPDSRTHDDLERQLGYLSRMHNQTLSSKRLGAVPPEVTMIVDATQGSANQYELNLKLLRSQVSVENVDVIVRFRDRPGQDLNGRLELAPLADSVAIDPDSAPPWLR